MRTAADNSPCKILLIDDESSFRQVIAKSLVKSGFEVVQASDGKEGLSRAAESLPDLILCDLMMPQMSGYEVLAALRRDEKLADIPVIFLTAQSEPKEVRQGMNLGADDYLTKPADLLDLLAAIEARLNRHQSERQRQERQMDRAMQLFAEIVHDLRNPLFAVLVCADQLNHAAGAPDVPPERAEQILAGMRQGVARMQEILSETMFVVRSRMKRQPLHLSTFDLRDFCELLLNDYEAGGRLRFHCAAGPFPVVADALRLRHALENLLSNALKYSDGLVEVSLTHAGQDYRIEVRDQGIGIPQGEQATIFEPFFRASNTRGKAGHGLGLCVVQSCVEAQGGSIRFVSEPNQGTAFTIDLPKSPPGGVEKLGAVSGFGMPAEKLSGLASTFTEGDESAAALARMAASGAEQVAYPQPRPPEAPPPGTGLDTQPRRSEAAAETTGKMRALVVEDDVVVRNVLRDLLDNSNDVQVLGVAGTVAQARLLASQQKPAVVFLDVNLPDGSGFDLLPDLGPDVAVVFVTSAEEYAARAFDCEATDYLVKPVSTERLRQALVRVRRRLAGKAAVASPTDSVLTGSFLVKTLSEKRLVKICDIKSILAYGEYSWVYWDQNKKGALLRKSLKQWQSELPSEQFIRVHRRAIVNLAFLERIERLPFGRLQVYLRDMAEPIMVSLSQAPLLNRKLKALNR